MTITGDRSSRGPRGLLRHSRGAVAALTVGGVALLLTSCTASAPSAGGSGSTLTIFESSPPNSLNPAQNNSPVDAPVVDLAYGNLFYQVTPTEYKPELGKSFRYVGSGNREIQIVLQPNVLFSDGTKLTSQLEAESIKYSIKAGGIGPSQFPLKKIETPNATTLDIFFTQAFPFAEAEFSQQGGVGSPISEAGMHGGKIGFQSYGAGAYELDTSATQTGSVYTFVKNPHYFDASQQKWSKVVLKVLGNGDSAIQAAAAATNAYAAGSVLQNNAAKAAGLLIAPVAQTKSYGLLISDRSGKISKPLGNVKVRQALNYAVDRVPDANALLGSPLEQLNEGGFIGNYTPDIYSYDVAKAKSLLSAAGYPNGFSFEAVVNGSDPTSVKTAQLLVSDFSKVGVTMSLVTATTQGTFGSDQMSKKYPADVDQMPGNVLSFVQATLFPGAFFNFFDEPVPSTGFTTKYAEASTLDGQAASTAWASLNREVQQNYVWLVNVAAVAPSYYSTKTVSVPKTYGITPNPLYVTPVG